MPWFMESGDPDPWLGRLLREEPEGWLVTDREGVPKYLRRSLGKMVDTPTLDATVTQAWRSEYGQPVVNPDTIPTPRRGVEVRRRYKNLPPAGGYDALEPPISLLEFKINGAVVMRGSKTAGINMKLDDAEVITGGTATVTIWVGPWVGPPRPI